MPELDTILVVAPVAACSNTLYLTPLESRVYLLSRAASGVDSPSPRKAKVVKRLRIVALMVD